MKIRSLMVSDPITITEETSIQKALALMKENKIQAERKKDVVYYRAATKGSAKSAIDS